MAQHGRDYAREVAIVQKGKPPAAIQKVTMLIALSILDLVGPLPSFTPGGEY